MRSFKGGPNPTGLLSWREEAETPGVRSARSHPGRPREDSEKAATCRSGREPPPGTNPVRIWILDFRPPSLSLSSFLLLKSPA